MNNKQTITQPNTYPTAHICINKSRMKIYHKESSPTYYLVSGTEFSIELSNPTTSVVLAKIILNGKYISQGGLVLNPGQRVFLDRYLDVAKKFLFDTYDVANTAEMKKAIEDNGDFKVEFYKEQVINPFNGYYNGNITLLNTPYNGYYNNHSGSPVINLCGSTSFGGVGTARGNSGASTLTTGTITNASTSNYYSNSMGADGQNSVQTSANLNSPTMDSFSDTQEPQTKSAGLGALRSKSLFSKKSIETGRVEKGSHSDQSLKYVNKDFEYFAFHTIEYKLLPISQKVNTVDDINVKRHCTKCSAKVSKGDNFCSHCGLPL